MEDTTNTENTSTTTTPTTTGGDTNTTTTHNTTNTENTSTTTTPTTTGGDTNTTTHDTTNTENTSTTTTSSDGHINTIPVTLPWDNTTRWDNVVQFLAGWKETYLKNETDFERRKEGVEVLLKHCINMVPRGINNLPPEFFQEPLTMMINKIEEGPTIFKDGLYATQISKPSTIHLTKEKTFVLMCLSFFGFFSYSFTELLRNSEYVQCMGNYYVRMYKETQKDQNWMQKPMKIERRVLTDDKVPDWENSSNVLTELQLYDNNKIGIEDLRYSCQVNFADPYPGGTLPSSHGDIVQEEILFLVYPELFITCILVPPIDTREAILVQGLTRTNKYKGYQSSFTYQGDFSADSNAISILHMDALPGGERDIRTLNRELNKAYIAFTADTQGKPISTGHWGCGAFGGNHQRKAVIQLIVAAEAGVDLQYTTHGTKHVNGLREFHRKMVQNRVTVGTLYKALTKRLGWGRSQIFDEIEQEVLKDPQQDEDH